MAQVKRRLETPEAGQVCGLERWRALVSMRRDHGHGVLACALGMLTPIRMAVEEGGGHISKVATTAPSSQCVFVG